jgi:hypothetical protein
MTLYRGTLSILYHYIKAISLIMLQRDDHVYSDNDMFVRSGIWTHAFVEDRDTAIFSYWSKDSVLKSGALDRSAILTTSDLPKFLCPTDVVFKFF